MKSLSQSFTTSVLFGQSREKKFSEIENDIIILTNKIGKHRQAEEHNANNYLHFLSIKQITFGEFQCIIN